MDNQAVIEITRGWIVSMSSDLIFIFVIFQNTAYQFIRKLFINLQLPVILNAPRC